MRVGPEGIEVTATGWFFVRGIAMVLTAICRQTATAPGFRASSDTYACHGRLDCSAHGTRRRVPLPGHVLCALRSTRGQAARHRRMGMPSRWCAGRRVAAYCSARWLHVGRLVGYASAGALAALAMDSLAWLTQQTTALRPAWTLMHVAVMAWGLMMMVQSPACLGGAGGSVRGACSTAGRGARRRDGGRGPVGPDALRAALFGPVGRGAQWRAAGDPDHGPVCRGQRVWLVGGPWAWAAFATA